MSLAAAAAGRLGDARAKLAAVFGYPDFRPGQDEVIAAVLAGEDVLAVMPTGSGKSMCYQLPPLVDGGLTLVVSPLIALMRDQVAQLSGFGIAAATLNSMTGEREAQDAWQAIGRRELRLLFVSPERLGAAGLAGRLRDAGVSRFAIDEAHCVSAWGHDFRPEYRGLAQHRAALGHPPTLALTATADEATRRDIAAQLFPAPPRIFVHGFDRPNIHLRFEAKDQPRRQIDRFLAGRRGENGIIYCSSRKRSESWAAWLAEKGVRALPYHAGMEAAERARNQEVFLQEDGVVMCATVAFGMGINKPDVRFVIHADMPANVESWYQEIGRAGRDGLPAHTLTLYGLEDMALRRRQIAEKGTPEEQKRVEVRKLSAMIALCEQASCRRRAMLAYFGDTLGTCSGCDACEGRIGLEDLTIEAQKAMSAIARTGARFGAGHIIDILIGRETEAVTRRGHHEIKTFGVGRDRDASQWGTIIRQMVAAEALVVTGDDYPVLALTGKGEAILRGRERILLKAPLDRAARRAERRGTAPAAAPAAGRNDGLFQALRALRLSIAKAEGIAAFMVFPDRTLLEMAERRPKSLQALAAVHGVGARKLTAYGRAFLEAIAAFEEG